MSRAIAQHEHAKARAAAAQVAPTTAATGIDYLNLNLVHARHTGEVADRLRYDRLPTDSAGPNPRPPTHRPDPALEAELASFAALRAGLRAGPPAGQVPFNSDQLNQSTLLEADRAAHGGQAS